MAPPVLEEIASGEKTVTQAKPDIKEQNREQRWDANYSFFWNYFFACVESGKM